MNGIWQLRIADQVGADVGTLGCARLTITNSAFVARAAVFARAGVVEVEFVNFRFNPTDLKVCKIAGSPALLGVNFNFTVALVSPVSQPGDVPLFPAFSTTVDVLAGDAAQGGNCTFVNGAGLLGGAFNQGSTITITETAGTVSAITCGSCGAGGLAVDLPNRRATLSGPNGLVAGINAVAFTNTAVIPPAERAVRYDFDGDHKSDASVFTPSNGKWTWKSSAANSIVENQFGVATDKLVPADYDGDRKTDYAVWRPSTGEWYFLGTTGVYEVHNWGEAGDIPQVGDFDGDGRSDFVVFRPSNGTWYVKLRTNEFRIFQFGIPTDKPYSADYDGDGRTDAGVFRNGVWYTLGSTQGFRITPFGAAGDIPVPADYDGDGAADFAVYRNGTWYMLSATTYTVKQHGTSTDVPVPADYDGDNKTDLAIFRPSEGKWYIKKSSQGEGSADETVSLGSASDTPLPAPAQ
jgi:putative transposon-encoded protein